MNEEIADYQCLFPAAVDRCLPAIAVTIIVADEMNRIRELATVCDKIVSEKTVTRSRGEPAFVNLDSAYPSQAFTIWVWGEAPDISRNP
jgi:hypothetical protein